LKVDTGENDASDVSDTSRTLHVTFLGASLLVG